MIKSLLVFVCASIFSVTNPEAETFFKQGYNFFHKRMFDEAIDAYTNALEINPAYEQAYFNRGLSYINTENFSAAKADFLEVALINPSHDKANLYAGYCSLKQKNYTESVRLLSEAAAINPSHQDIWYFKGLANKHLENWSAALADFEKAIRIDPRHTEAHFSAGVVSKKQGDTGLAKYYYERVLSIDPSHTKASHNLANLLLLDGQHAAAVENLKNVTNTADASAEVYYTKATANHQRGLHDLAIKDYRKALDIDPTHEQTRLNLAIAYHELHLYNKVISTLEPIKKHLNASVAALLVDSYIQTDAAENAYATINRALREQSSKSSKASLLAQRASLKMHEESYKQALADAQEALSLDASAPTAAFIAGNAAFQLHKYEKAVQFFNQSLALNSEDARAYFMRGKSYMSLKFYSGACADFQQSRKLGYDVPQELSLRCR